LIIFRKYVEKIEVPLKSDKVVPADTLARGTKLLSIKKYVIEIMT